ncbi:hypothetical protein CDD82_4900 [Ophiocordyceps australis]|uniref:Fungal lipase-type domain-containing protein n=1 Tax=Ophiocordyceps australis TaxID=1399860 RepID=A0A2C5Z493_9HYPO|nr:hypothetical protein CDD82_4900 [Ophiocordyceps australis]
MSTYWKATLLAVCHLYLGALPAHGEKTPIDQALFDSFKRYTEISSAAYADECAEPPQAINITKRISNTKTDTQAFLARDEQTNEWILAFRGSSSAKDFLIDLDSRLVPFETAGVTDCKDCKAHQGILKAWNSVSQETIAAVKAALAETPDAKLTVTGHSLGATLASLATLSLVGSDVKVTATYTFGQPRTGNQVFADFADATIPAGKLFRVTHANDGVPQVFTADQGFQHHSTEFWQEDDSDDASKTFKCEGQEPQDCNNSVRGTGIGPGGRGLNAAHTKYAGIKVGAEICNSKDEGQGNEDKEDEENVPDGDEKEDDDDDDDKNQGPETRAPFPPTLYTTP